MPRAAAVSTRRPPSKTTTKRRTATAVKPTVSATPPVVYSKEDLLRRFAPLVRHVVERVAATLPRNVDHEDLYSAGVLGLLDAHAKFDLRKSFRGANASRGPCGRCPKGAWERLPAAARKPGPSPIPAGAELHVTRRASPKPSDNDRADLLPGLDRELPAGVAAWAPAGRCPAAADLRAARHDARPRSSFPETARCR